MSISSLLRPALAVLVFGLLAACQTTTTVFEPQNRRASAGEARIYLLRPWAWGFSALGARVKINGVEVGSLANDSYMSLVRPVGRHTLNVSFPPYPWEQAEHTFDVAGGRTYYFAVNLRSGTIPIAAGGFFTTFTIPGSEAAGQPVGSSNLLAGWYLSELDARAGEAAVAAMKAR